MASALSVERLRSRLFARMHDHDPGATTAILASPDGGTTPWVFDLAEYPGSFLVGVKPSIVGGNGITLVRVIAYTDSAATANGTEIKTSGAVQLDHLSSAGGDQVWLEFTAEEVRQIGDAAGVALRYVAVEITTSTNTDEAVVTVIAMPRFPRTGLTATQQA